MDNRKPIIILFIFMAVIVLDSVLASDGGPTYEEIMANEIREEELYNEMVAYNSQLENYRDDLDRLQFKLQFFEHTTRNDIGLHILTPERAMLMNDTLSLWIDIRSASHDAVYDIHDKEWQTLMVENFTSAVDRGLLEQ